MSQIEPVATGQAPPRVPWWTILFVAGVFFVIEHVFNAQELYRMLTGAQSLDEFEGLSRLFEPRAWRQIAGLAMGGIGLALILRRWRPGSGTLGFLGGLLVLYLAWNTASLIWAEPAALTLRRLGLLYMLVLGAAGVSSILSLRQILLLALIWPALYLVAGVGAELAQGTFKPWESGYRFAGTIHPNAQGINCALLFLAGICCYRDAKYRKLVLAAIVLALVFLYLTKSRTALASVVAVLLVYWGMMRSRSGKVALASAVLMAGSMVFLFSSVVFPRAQDVIRMGRTDVGQTPGALTGRRDLWDQLSGFVGERPVLGYGYGAFWDEPRSREVIDEQGWPISHAHNAYVDVLLEGGPVALVLYLLILITGITLSFAYFRETGNNAYTFFSVLLLFCALNGILESVAVQRSQATFLGALVLIELAFRPHPQPAWNAAPIPPPEGAEQAA
jgi:exopolysaccharide production protein ExoQ